MGNQSGPLSLTELSEADETGTTVGDSVSEENIEGNGEKVFELRHFPVIFPPGKLKVATGPTASGKTAFLVRYYVHLMLSPSF